MSAEAKVDNETGDEKLTVRITTPRDTTERQADFLIVPGKNGLVGIMPNHTTLVSLLREGEIVLKRRGASDEKVPVREGIIQVNPTQVDILINA